jgi:hypothetical protein
VEDRDQTAKIRDLVKRNYERGLEDGRSSEREENGDVHPRIVLLHASADILDSMKARSEKIPNSERAVGAYNEASAILRDAAERGENHLG